MQTGYFCLKGDYMQIFDAHCDVLWQLWSDRKRQFINDPHLHITMENLLRNDAKIQCFAIYVPENVSQEQRFLVALEMVDIFYKEIIEKHPHMKVLLSKADVDNLKDGEIGALLTLEGCDAIDKNIVKLETLYRLGVRSVGLTWNYSNAVADGVLEPRGAGLSSFGFQVVEHLNAHGLWTDVSHLSVKGFWDVIGHATYPVASHSNCRSLCDHPRNLTDEQIRALLQKDGVIGITFVPSFITEGPAHISHILKHIEHICMLGGEKQLGFGSDFDGITETVEGLSSYADYPNLINILQKHYSERQVEGFLYKNFTSYINF